MAFFKIILLFFKKQNAFHSKKEAPDDMPGLENITAGEDKSTGQLRSAAPSVTTAPSRDFPLISVSGTP